MEDNKNMNMEEEEVTYVTLTDEETGEEIDFEVLADELIDGKRYVALIAADEENNEYVILEVKEDGEELIFETVDDDDVFEKLEDYFNDLFFSEMNYDEQ